MRLKLAVSSHKLRRSKSTSLNQVELWFAKIQRDVITTRVYVRGLSVGFDESTIAYERSILIMSQGGFLTTPTRLT